MPVLICALFFGVLYAYNVYPFSKTCMSNYDLLAQICPFLEHFYDVLDGKSSLFYSTAIIGGTDVFGTLAYCAVSPFTFLFLLCGRGNVYYAVSFVLPIKLSCVAVSAVFFIKKTFKEIPDHITLAVSILYAYCGYTFVANTYINWVDFLIYMPFVVMGFKALVTRGKIRYFAVSYALMIYTCFSIACFALLMVYVILIGYMLIVVPSKDRKRLLVRACLALVCAVALSLPITVPSLKAYITSGRNTGLFENLGKDLDAKHLYAKTSYVLSDTLFLMATIFYFITCKFKKKTDWFYLFVGVIIMLPVMIDEVCNLLNFGSYMSYALRFGFLNAAYGLYMTCLLLVKLKNQKSRGKVWSFVGTLVFLLLAVAVVVFVISFNDEVTSQNLFDFSSKFAHSLGGLEVIAPVFGVIAGLLVVAFLFYLLKVGNVNFIVFALIGVFAVQVAFYNVHLVKGNKFNPVRYEQYNAIFNKVADVYEDGTEYYRIKDYDAAISNDAPFTTHTSSFSVFSSVIDKTNLTATTFFGYGGNKINSIESKGGLFFGDALLGYKYYFLHNDGKHHASEDRSYNRVLTDTQLSYFVAGQNDLVFPNAYFVNNGGLSFGDDYFENMQALYTFLGGEGQLFDEYEIPLSKISYDEQTGVYNIHVNILDEGQWYLKHDFPDDLFIKYSRFSSEEEKLNLLDRYTVVNFNYGKRAPNSYYYCYIKPYADKKFTKSQIAEYCKGYCMPLSKIQALKDLLYARKANYTIDGGNKFNVTVNADGEDCYLYMNYVAIDGFTATVNGKKVDLTDNGLKFIMVKLDQGDNQVTLEYHSPYPKLILVGVMLGAVILALVYLLLRKWKRLYGAVENVVNVSAYLLAFAVVGFFLLFPTCVFLVKLVKLLWGLVF